MNNPQTNTMPRPNARVGAVWTCRKCGAHEPDAEFYRYMGRGKLRKDSYCKPCRRKISREWEKRRRPPS